MDRRTISDIGNFIFINDEPRKVDVIFIPGSSKWEVSEKAAELYRAGFSQCIVPSGKYSSKLGHFAIDRIKGSDYDGEYSYDYEFCKHVLIANGVDKNNILCETQSTNTYENALFSKALLDEYGMKISSAIVCCQAFHARRALMSYAHVFPNVEILIASTITREISKETWFLNTKSIKIVMGEVSKIGNYFSEYYTSNFI